MEEVVPEVVLVAHVVGEGDARELEAGALEAADEAHRRLSATRALSAARSSPNESRMMPKKRLSHSVATITQKASEYTVAVAYRGCGGVIRSSDSPMSPRRIPSDITVTQHESTSWHGEPSAANSCAAARARARRSST